MIGMWKGAEGWWSGGADLGVWVSKGGEVDMKLMLMVMMMPLTTMIVITMIIATMMALEGLIALP